MRISVKTFTFLLVILTGLCLSGNGNLYAQLGTSSTAVDFTKKFNDIKAKADKGDVESQCWLAICYDMGLYGCKIDESKAYNLHQKVAEHNNENLPAVLFSKALFSKNPNEGAKWLQKAAEQGFAPAQSVLGGNYEKGKGGVPKNNERAVYWIRKAVDQGYAPAQVVLAGYYGEGKVVPKNDEEAVNLIRKAANQGFALGRFAMGACYENGVGNVRSNSSEAVKFYRMAAVDQGFAPAQLALGSCYFHGSGVAKDIPESVRLRRMAANQGLAEAQALVGGLYITGTGGFTKNYSEGVKLLHKAYNQGFAPAGEVLKQLGEK